MGDKMGFYNVDLAIQLGFPAAVMINKIEYMCRNTKDKAGFCWISDKDMSMETGLPVSTIRRTRKFLVDSGLLEVKRTFIPGTSICAMHYKLIDTENTNRENGDNDSGGQVSKSETSETLKTDTSQVTESETSQVTKSDTSYIYKNNNIINNKRRRRRRIIISDENSFFDLIYQDYKNICTDLIPWTRITTKQVQKINALLEQGYKPEDFKTVFINAQNNSFLCGVNDKHWKANIDWLLNPKNFLNVLEGVYRSDQTKPNHDLDEIYKSALEDCLNS